MDDVGYINSFLDRLLQRPGSNIASFFHYVIDGKGFYRYHFGTAKSRGEAAYERIVGLLGHESKTIRDIALALLREIAKGAMVQKPPDDSLDPNGWREWGKKEFEHDWKPR